MNRLQLTLAGVFGAGVLLTGLGTGIALKEYTSLEYSGEHIIGEADIQTKTGELRFGEIEEGEMYRIYCGSDEYEVVKDDSVPEQVVKYEAVYNKNSVRLDVHGETDARYYSIVGWWKGASEFEQIMSCKDEILKELKQNKIGSYRVMQVQKVKLTVNPQMAEKLYVE